MLDSCVQRVLIMARSEEARNVANERNCHVDLSDTLFEPWCRCLFSRHPQIEQAAPTFSSRTIHCEVVAVCDRLSLFSRRPKVHFSDTQLPPPLTVVFCRLWIPLGLGACDMSALFARVQKSIKDPLEPMRTEPPPLLSPTILKHTEKK